MFGSECPRDTSPRAARSGGGSKRIPRKNLAKAGAHTIILSTHILPEVEQTCERVIIINKGQLVATDTALFVTAEAVQLCGATGVSEEFPVIHLFNDAKIAQIVEGANDVQRMVLARALLA